MLESCNRTLFPGAEWPHALGHVRAHLIERITLGKLGVEVLARLALMNGSDQPPGYTCLGLNTLISGLCRNETFCDRSNFGRVGDRGRIPPFRELWPS